MLNVKATDICKNCGDEFANHQYVPDSLTKYHCRIPHQESGYGFFHGGDPRKFHPDSDSSEQEIENHCRACELWDRAEFLGETPEPESCPSGWIYDDEGVPICHVLRAPYGLGVWTEEYEQFCQTPSPKGDGLQPSPLVLRESLA